MKSVADCYCVWWHYSKIESIDVRLGQFKHLESEDCDLCVYEVAYVPRQNHTGNGTVAM